MSRNFEIYRTAARLLKPGLANGRGVDYKGRMCLLQAVAKAADIEHWSWVPLAMLRELDSELLSFRGYRMTEARSRVRADGIGLLGCIFRWNDMPVRRKRTVIKMLNRLADRLEQEYLRDQAVITTVVPARVERDYLAEMDKHLNTVWHDLQQQRQQPSEQQPTGI